MKPIVGFILLAFAFLLFTPIAASAQQASPIASSAREERYKDALKESHNTIYFTENKGQWEPSVVMQGHTNVGSLVIKKDQMYFLSKKGGHHDEEGEEHEDAEEHEEDEEDESYEVHGWGIFFDGMNTNFRTSTSNEIVTKYNYFLGNNPSHWASNVNAYGDVTMHGIYNGIDLRMYSQEDHALEFDWIVNPGADYRDIVMRFKGQEGLRVDEKGHLAVKLHFDEVKFDIPEAYQIIDGKKVEVKVAFKVKGDVATFAVDGKVDSRYALIIDPSLKWGTWFDNNDNGFDEYLYAVDYDNSGNVYCGGKINVQVSNAYITPGVFGYDASYNNGVDAILYKIKADGTDVLVVTYYGGSGNDGIYGVSLSPDKSVIYTCGTSNGTIPTTSGAFDTSNDDDDGFVAVFPASTFGSLTYATYLGGSGNADQMVSVRGLSNNSFVVGGTVNGALPASYISGAYDATYSGSTEMYIAKFTTFSTLAFGTYVGGSDVEQLNDLQVFSDGALAFTGYTASSTATFPGLVSTGGAAGNGRDGVVGVIPANGGTFSMLSRIGGSGVDEFYGLAIGPFDTLFITGITQSSNLPLGPGASASTRFDVTANGSEDAFIGKIPRTGGANSWIATYFGGSGNDRGNTLRTYTPYAIMVFGETGSNNFPVLNLADGGAFYDGTFNGGSWDIFWMVLGTDLRTQYFATYVGGGQNDYLGATGAPRGSNHFVVEGDTLITLGTTVHSRTLQPTVIGPTTGSLAVFDPVNTEDTDNDDLHLIFKWRLGGNLLNFDYGDAPVSYGTPHHYIFNSIKLGANIDREDFHPLAPGTRANDDDLNGASPDDEDAIAGTQVMIEDSALAYNVTFPITNSTGGSAYVMGWIDFNRNGAFESSEQAKQTVANGATSATLSWTVPSLWSAGSIDTSYLRLRITADAAYNVTNPSPSAGPALNGEVEDYLVIRYHCVDLTPALVTTQNPTGCGVANGSITITNANLLPIATYGIYYTFNGGAPQGPFYLNTANNGSIVIPNLSAGTYSAIQVFHPTNPACGDTLANPIVLTSPTSPPPSNLTASATCVGGTLTLTANGTLLAWTGPGGFTASGSPVTRTNATTAMSGTYSVTQTVSGCTSLPATINVTINSNPTVSATTSTPTICAGSTINLSATPSPTGTYTYVWSGPNGFNSTLQNPSITNASTAAAGTYSVTVTSSTTGCVGSGSTPSITVNAAPTPTASTSTPTVCSGGTISLTSSASPGTFTYSWSGPASFTSTAQNPSRTSVTTAMSGVYTVTATNTSTGCTATASTSNITVNQSPTVVASVGSPAYCTGQTISLSASPSGGTSPYTYSWSGPSSFTSTAQNPTRATATTAFAGVYNVTITDANNCSGTAASPSVVVNQAPTVTAAVGSPTYCSGATLTLTSTPSPSGTYTYTWSGPNSFASSVQNPTIPSVTTAATGSYTVTVVAGTNCSASATTGTTTVNQTPTAIASSSSNTYCAGTTIQLNS
ncbi:MAG: hypothetical protein JST49_14810, partial [Bacteroidetes bacterium]|nr:hypothetical protein [Bacteroidota bacterium]